MRVKTEDINTGSVTDENMKELEQIAMDCDTVLKMRGDIQDHGSDSEDFPAVSIAGIREMLKKAYVLGQIDYINYLLFDMGMEADI